MRLVWNATLLLPVLCAALACDTPPDVTPSRDRLTAVPDSVNVQFGQTIDITITARKGSADGSTSPGEGTVTATIAEANAANGFIAQDGAVPLGPTAQLTLDPANGQGKFLFQCAETAADVAITFEGDQGTANLTINCVPPVDPRNLVFDIRDCEDKLIADGQSSCLVTVSASTAGTNAPVANVTLNVTASVSDTGANTVLSQVGNDSALASINVTTALNGSAQFLVRSTSTNEERIITLVVTDDRNNRNTQDVSVGEFVDKSAVRVIFVPSALSSGQESKMTIEADEANGTRASAKKASFTFTENDFTITTAVSSDTDTPPATCLRAGNVVQLDSAGRCTLDIVAAELGVNEGQRNTIASATFTSIPGRTEPKTGSATLSIVPAGVTAVNFEQTDAIIFADRQPGSTAITVTITRDNAPVVADATVRATVSSDSTGVIKLSTQQVGGGNTAVVDSDDLTTIVDPANGTVTFTVVPDNALARGNGKVRIEVEVTDNGVRRVIVGEQNITVDRDPLLSSIRFTGFEGDSIIGVPGGSRASATAVTFQLTNEENQPVPGIGVRFVAQSAVPGVTIVPNALSDGGGNVKTVVTAGRVAGAITIIAIVDNPSLSANAEPIAVVGGQPNSALSFVRCDVIASEDPFTSGCTVQLADKFTNRVETALNVQFRAEGGNITPAVLSSGGEATATFAFAQPGPGSADVRGWSYGAFVPSVAPNVGNIANDFRGCFDNTTSTPCDILKICRDANDPAVAANVRAALGAMCPLPALLNGASSCVQGISATSITALDNALGVNGDLWQLEVDTGFDFFAGADAREQYFTYLDEYRTCGFPLGCLTGQTSGVPLDITDDCPINAGCFDFSGATECPQDGLLDILAAVRGEEGYDDENGNGVRDAGESFVDFPEPFLDKNSSCSFDNLNTSTRLTPSQKIALSDLFIDSDPNDGFFGFGQGANDPNRRETNGAFDTDTEISLKTSIVLIDKGDLQFGEIGPAAATCFPGGVPAAVTCSEGQLVATPSSGTCVETALGDTILQGCAVNPGPGPLPNGAAAPSATNRPTREGFRDGNALRLAFRWTDKRGNCPSPNFEGTPGITAEGPVKVLVDDVPLTPEECGAVPGGIGSNNAERVWCEEHPAMGAPVRGFTLVGDCAGAQGPQEVKLTFSLDNNTKTAFLTVGCPVCGDALKEGDEECDDGPTGSTTCDAACAIVEDDP